MTHPIGGQFPLPPPQPAQSPALNSVSLDLQQLIQTLSKQLQTALEDPTVASEGSFLGKIAHTIAGAEPLAEKCRSMGKNIVKDTSENLVQISMQPQDIPGSIHPISLVNASQNYNDKDPAHTDLSKMIRFFSSNSQATTSLINELNLMGQDLKSDRSKKGLLLDLQRPLCWEK